jgi:hypothetical protein
MGMSERLGFTVAFGDDVMRPDGSGGTIPDMKFNIGPQCEEER